VRKAQVSEDRIARLPIGPQYPRLAPAPLPLPSPLDRPLAKLSGIGAQPAVQPMPAPNPSVTNEAPPPTASQDWGPTTEAAGPQSTLTIANDALDIITRKRPRSITLREDGLFQLSCADGEYLVGPDGKLVRKEPPNP
jgi:hypothetical protein